VAEKRSSKVQPHPVEETAEAEAPTKDEVKQAEMKAAEEERKNLPGVGHIPHGIKE
jgi:hypothetical protein